MASNEHYPHTPNLASILQTLASLTPQNHQQGPAAPYTIPQALPGIPPHIRPQPNPHHNTAPTLESFLPTADQARSAQVAAVAPASVPQKNIIDPTTILEWSAGLKCVMRTVAKHENVIHEVRRMMKLQHEHEEQWWRGRLALMEKLKAREEGQKKLDEVLRAVVGVASAARPTTTAEDIARELQTFDLKVYKAQMQMIREMNIKLRSLGVPFFGTRTDLIRPAGKEPDPTKDEKGMIDEAELVQLQRRMLEMLEDLCSN
ncbi:hypothetical protein K3495_g8650 [Podosphaera aphanis]|nr:hypothetical protein K3495_g8650 [Podosphaera aphanis]